MAVNTETNQTVALIALLLKRPCCITCMKDIKFPSCPEEDTSPALCTGGTWLLSHL